MLNSPFDVLILFLTAFVHDDLAIVSAGYYVVERGVPAAIAAATVYLGIVVWAGILYGIGALARRLPTGAQRWLVGARLERAQRRAGQGLLLAVALCRVTPGLLLPTFLACGFFRVPFVRFALINAAAAALYVPLMLVLIITFGEIVQHRISEWVWLVPPGMLAVTAFVAARRYRVGRGTA